AGALALARALASGEAAFRERVWPEHERAIAGARELLERVLAPKEAAALEYLRTSLGLDEQALAVPVYLVADAPPPRAVTQRDDAGRGVCFVGVRGAEGTQLVESVLHEATHALDVAQSRGGVLADLRRRLAAAGLQRTDRELRDVPHTLMFVQAGETV